MILTTLSTKDLYNKYPAAVMRAIAYLKANATAIPVMTPGKYPIEGEAMFAKVFDVTTLAVADTHPELHKKYVDVQYWATGEELMGYAPNTGGTVVLQADEVEDLYFLQDVPNEVFLPAHSGDVMVLFPEDIHRPAIRKDAPVCCRKVVVKVSVDLL